MHKTLPPQQAIAGLQVGVTASAMEKGAAKLTPLHREVLATLPRDRAQEIRVLEARLEPGDRTMRHSHRFPVTIHVHEGTFTLDLEGQAPVTVRAGEVFVEPAHVPMTGRNLDPVLPTRMSIFYVCTPETPFADLLE